MTESPRRPGCLVILLGGKSRTPPHGPRAPARPAESPPGPHLPPLSVLLTQRQPRWSPHGSSNALSHLQPWGLYTGCSLFLERYALKYLLGSLTHFSFSSLFKRPARGRPALNPLSKLATAPVSARRGQVMLRNRWPLNLDSSLPTHATRPSRLGRGVLLYQNDSGTQAEEAATVQMSYGRGRRKESSRGALHRQLNNLAQKRPTRLPATAQWPERMAGPPQRGQDRASHCVVTMDDTQHL